MSDVLALSTMACVDTSNCHFGTKPMGPWEPVHGWGILTDSAFGCTAYSASLPCADGVKDFQCTGVICDPFLYLGCSML